MGLQVLRRPGLHPHPDSPLLLRRQHVHQHRRSHLRHPLLMAGLQPDSRFYRQQSPADARATVRHLRLLPCDSENRGRRHLRSGNCGSSKKIPVRVRPARNRSCRLPYMVQNIGNLCRRLKNRRADLTQQPSIIRQFQPVQTKTPEPSPFTRQVRGFSLWKAYDMFFSKPAETWPKTPIPAAQSLQSATLPSYLAHRPAYGLPADIACRPLSLPQSGSARRYCQTGCR